MTRLAADDASVLDELVARYWHALVAYAGDIVRDPDAAVDVAQEVFVRLWQRRHMWDERGSVRVWLFRTARNTSIGEYRKREVRARWASAQPDTAVHERTPLHETQDAELRDAVAAALEQLSPRRREAFTLFHLRDLSYREVAEVMGINEQSVANHLQAALADLRVALRSYFPALDSDSPDTLARRSAVDS